MALRLGMEAVSTWDVWRLEKLIRESLVDPHRISAALHTTQVILGLNLGLLQAVGVKAEVIAEKVNLSGTRMNFW